MNSKETVVLPGRPIQHDSAPQPDRDAQEDGQMDAALLQDDADDEIVVVDPGAPAIFVEATDEVEEAVGEAEVESLLEPVLDVGLASGQMTHVEALSTMSPDLAHVQVVLKTTRSGRATKLAER